VSKKDKNDQQQTAPVEEPEQQAPEQEPETQAPEQPQAEHELTEVEQARAEMEQFKDKYARLLAEYENYRRRTAKEKEALWAGAKCDVTASFLPVYDNLERALKQETADEAYKKGVEMTMNQLKTVMEKLGVTEIPALGEPFDPKVHNAVMHIEDDTLGENTVVEVFQAGFQLGEKVIRCAMVKVAN